ncbi:MAG TPA: DNA translocase FtsK 4TM domain-containing protein [Gemmatimonadaceae bacterium]|nr:DNA translocase FtsK 4TM domain-containing protein [Gemmatimonadaceae bacterium]
MRDSLKRELTAIALLLLAVFLGGALVVLGLAQLRAGVDVGANVGWVGAHLAKPLVALLGWPAALLVPLVPLVHALRVFGRLRSDTDRSWMIFLIGLVLLLPVGVALAQGLVIGDDKTAAAGLWGALVAEYWRAWFGGLGSWVLVALGLSALMAATLAWNPIRALVGVRHGEAVAAKPRTANLALELAPAPEEMPAIDPEDVEPEAPDEPEAPAPPRKRGKKRTKAEAAAERDDAVKAAIDASALTPEAVMADELPGPELLTPPPVRAGDGGKRELDEMGQKLIDALHTFRVDGELVGRTTGPVVTQFEIEPAPGVKVRQFANLANDLALAMRAQSIRIVAPIPGRGAVGVEVPNPTSEMVSFRELIESREFQSARAALPIALGKDLEGKPVIADLAKMPHLLIAGATGSGKSVCVNTIITSLVYRHTPRTLRLLMVDPKMVELSVYNTLPHLRHKVVTDNRDAAAVLHWAKHEMDERYRLLAANGCRNLQEFNKRVLDGAPLKRPKQDDVAFEELTYTGDVLPYIVIVIDEMADLMMTVQGEVEGPIAMLAQKARAIGIHLLLATQRPSVNVITGLIKANFPSRIAFRVASQVDSRTIIDGAGAEALLGNGDMLFIPPGKSEASRLQGAFIASEDTENLMAWYRGRAEARRKARLAQGLGVEEASEEDIIEAIRARERAEAEAAQGGDAEADGGDRDKIFRDAAEAVIHNQGASTSLLQRRLGIGYGRAARIMDQLEAAGVIGKQEPGTSKPREVLVGLEDLDRICGPRA